MQQRHSQLKQERQKTVGKFVEWLREHNHPALESVEKTYQAIKEKFTDPKTGKMNFTIFPSFYVMMDKLRESKIPFTIILRTFGSDLDEVMKEIEEHPKKACNAFVTPIPAKLPVPVPTAEKTSCPIGLIASIIVITPPIPSLKRGTRLRRFTEFCKESSKG